MNQLTVKVEIMRAAGLQDEEIVRLAWLKQRVEHGQCDELTYEFKRMKFFHYLYQAGRLHD